MGMWSPEWDLGADKRDLPCNTHIYFGIQNGALDMTVCCRSNDMLWGAYGANAVHFSVLQELISHALHVPMGVYRQFSNNFHLYTDLPIVQHFLDNPPAPLVGQDPYDGQMAWVPLISGTEEWDWFVGDCQEFIRGKDRFATTFMHDVARPLRDMYLARKYGTPGPFVVPEPLRSTDWGFAFQQWLDRRESR